MAHDPIRSAAGRLNQLQQLLTLKNCVIASIEDVDVGAQAASSFSCGMCLLLLIVVLGNDERDREIQFFHRKP